MSANYCVVYASRLTGTAGRHLYIAAQRADLSAYLKKRNIAQCIVRFQSPKLFRYYVASPFRSRIGYLYKSYTHTALFKCLL